MICALASSSHGGRHDRVVGVCLSLKVSIMSNKKLAEVARGGEGGRGSMTGHTIGRIGGWGTASNW